MLGGGGGGEIPGSPTLYETLVIPLDLYTCMYMYALPCLFV